MRRLDFARLVTLSALSALILHTPHIAATEVAPSNWQSNPSSNAAAGVNTESQNASPPGHKATHPGERTDPDRRLAHMTSRYKLTSDQQGQIKPILQNEQQQLRSARSDASASRDEKRTKMHAIRQASQTKVEAILTDSQRQEFEADQHMMEESRRAERKHGDATPASPETDQPPAHPQ